MKIRIFEKGFNFSQDGPGNRLVLHLQGCNLHCPWCANPEGIPVKPPIMTDEKYLIESVCPYGAIRGKTLDRAKCEVCQTRDCVTKNINKGTTQKCREYEIGELIEEITSASPMFFAGGGVTLTGGEPTLQLEAVLELLKKLKAEGVNTAIETNGTSPRLPELYPYIDHLMIDFKHSDNETLRRVTGAGNEILKQNIRAAVAAGLVANLRVPLVGGFNTTEENLRGTLEFIKTLDTKRVTLEFLRFHEYGREKWRSAGMEYKMDESARVPDETFGHFKETFAKNGIKLITT